MFHLKAVALAQPDVLKELATIIATSSYAVAIEENTRTGEGE